MTADDDFTVFPKMPDLTPEQKREMARVWAVTAAVVTPIVVLFIWGLLPVAVPLMCLFVWHASRTEWIDQ